MIKNGRIQVLFILCAFALLLYCFRIPARAEETLPSTAQRIPEESTIEGVTVEDYPRVDGSTATLPISRALYQLATGCSQKEADEAIVHTKTTNSYLRLIAGECDLLIVADKNDVVDQAAEKAQVELEIKPIALDPFVFMANEDNPVKSLTQEEIVKIYSGEITNWSEVGGEDRTIIPFQRNANAGSQTAMQSLVMQGKEMVGDVKYKIGTMSELLEAVASYNNERNALGYSYYYYANQMYRIPGLRFMAVDGVFPSPETVRSGAYPYIASYYAVIRKDEGDTTARSLFEWLCSTEGQELIADLGYIPVDEQVKLDGGTHADMQAEKALPIGEDECLAVMTERNVVTFFDRDGRIMGKLMNATLGGFADLIVRDSPIRIEVVKKNEPVIVMKMVTPEETKEGTTSEVRVNHLRAGTYIPAENRYAAEPVFQQLFELGDKLMTNSSVTIGSGLLMKKDGTILKDDPRSYYYSPEEGYILGHSAETGIRTVYTLEGESVISTTGFVFGAADGLYILTDNYRFSYVGKTDRIWEGSPVYAVNEQGKQIWEGKEGYLLEKMQDGFLCWSNADGTEWEITDTMASLLLNEEIFRRANPEENLPNIALEVSAVSQNKKQLFLKDRNGNGYYLCDEDFHIQEHFRKNEIVMEYPVDDWYDRNRTQKGNPWQVSLKKGRWIFREVLGEREIAFEEKPEQIRLKMTGVGNLGNIRSVGNLILIQMVCEAERKYRTVVVTALGEKQLFFDNASFSGERAGNAAVIDGLTKAVVSAEDGSLIAEKDSGIVFVGDNLQAVRRGAYLYLEDRDGKLYLRMLVEEE